MLLLLVMIPVIILLYWFRWVHVGRVRSQFNDVRRAGNPSTRWHFLATVFLVIVGSAALIIAAAEPRIEREIEREIYKKIDVVFLLDTSLSMRARDIAPSRLQRATQEIETFLQDNAEYIGRVGLVSFSGSSLILSYLTSDTSNILFFLDYLGTEDDPTLGTDIGAALKSGLTVLEKEQALDQQLEAKGVIFVLISDGEDHGANLQAEVARAAEASARIYTVGIGTEMGDYIPIGEEEGHTVFLTDQEGKQIMSSFDEATLRSVGEATGGRYFRSRSGSDLKRDLGAILESERTVVNVEKTVAKIPLHPWFLGFAFVALTLRLTSRP